jgi:hypothetical protein
MDFPSSVQFSRLPESLLAVGVLVALLFAIGGVVEDSTGLPETAVARVNGQLLMRENLDRLLERLEQQTGRPVGPAERAEVLSRLVDEELLLQQGLQLDIPRAEARIRSLIVQEVIRQAVAGSAVLPVEEQALVDFHASNRTYFRRPERLSVRAFLLPDAEAASHLASAVTWDPKALLPGAVPDPALPGSAVSEAKLADYIGSPLAGRVASLAVGETLQEPLGEGNGVRVLQLLAREPGTDPAFSAIRAQVETEFRRRRDEAALEEYVKGLREAARILRRESF